MFKKIVGFGDSWMYGDELTEPNITATNIHQVGLQHRAYRERNCFLGQLGDYYSVPVENFGIMGGSLDSARWTFLYWLEHEPEPESCLVLHAITNSYRFSHYNPRHRIMLDDPPWNRFVHSSWSLESEFQSLIKQQTVLTDSPELHQLRYQETTMLFDGISARHDILTMQFNVFTETYTLELPTLFTDWSLKNQTVNTKTGGHPDETGHKKIAQLLINLIDRAIIVA
jgi:hypothetical protein